MKNLFFAITAGSMIASCTPKPITIKPKPLVEYKQGKTQNKTQDSRPKTIRGTWKDGECWIERDDTVSYSYKIGENLSETKRFKTEAFLDADEKIKEMRCSEEFTYALTNKNLIVLAGASTVFFGKSEITLISRKIDLGDLTDKIISWLANESEAFFITRNSVEYIPYTSKINSRRFVGTFDKKTKMIFYKGLLLIVCPGKKEFLISYKPGDDKAKDYKADPPFNGQINFIKEKEKILIRIGSDVITIRINEGKIEF